MTTEAEALANILAWSADSPRWQRDALRRFATQAVLEPVDFDELLAICNGDIPAAPLNRDLRAAFLAGFQSQSPMADDAMILMVATLVGALPAPIEPNDDFATAAAEQMAML